MKIIAELEPTRNNEKLARRLRMLVPHVDAIDIPEVPVGKPIASAPMLAAYIKARYPEVEVMPHVRIIDVNKAALLSIVGGARATRIEELVLLRGDDPLEGEIVRDLKSVEEAAAYIKTRVRKTPLLGAMLSIRYPIEKIMTRLTAPLDFYLVLRATVSIRKLAEVSREAQRLGKRLYAYIIIVGEKNRKILRNMLGDQPLYTPQEALHVVEEISSLVDGILLSSPGDVDAVVEAAQRLYRRF